MGDKKAPPGPPALTWHEKDKLESDWEPKAPALAKQTAEWAKNAPDLVAAALAKKK